MQHLLRLSFLVILTVFFQVSQGQYRELNRLERDTKPIYYGLSLGAAYTYLHPSKAPAFLASDSIMVAEPLSSMGYTVGLLATARLHNHWELRFNPGLTLGIDRAFKYVLGSKELFEDSSSIKKIQSNIASFPLHFKFSSDRINNFKVYLLAGGKFDIDLASNAKSRAAEGLLKLNRFDAGAEVGLGFNFFLKYVTISPEVKFSNGFLNLHARDASLKYSNVLDKLNSRMIYFTIHLEE